MALKKRPYVESTHLSNGQGQPMMTQIKDEELAHPEEYEPRNPDLWFWKRDDWYQS